MIYLKMLLVRFCNIFKTQPGFVWQLNPLCLSFELTVNKIEILLQKLESRKAVELSEVNNNVQFSGKESTGLKHTVYLMWFVGKDTLIIL